MKKWLPGWDNPPDYGDSGLWTVSWCSFWLRMPITRLFGHAMTLAAETLNQWVGSGLCSLLTTGNANKLTQLFCSCNKALNKNV